MPFSLRLDADTQARIRRLTASTGRSKSDVVRDALSHYALAREAVPVAGASAFDRLRPFVGVIGCGTAQYSRDTHAKYRARLQHQHRARRSR